MAEKLNDAELEMILEEDFLGDVEGNGDFCLW